jgi:hypothetical protein
LPGVRSRRGEAGEPKKWPSHVIVDVLYFEGCPNHVRARNLVETVLSEHGVIAEIRVVCVIDAADAEEKRFLGSPSVRIDGIDVDPSVSLVERFGMMCRIYRQAGSLSGVPPREMIEDALTSPRLIADGHPDD